MQFRRFAGGETKMMTTQDESMGMAIIAVV